MVTAVALRGASFLMNEAEGFHKIPHIESRRDEMGEERGVFFDFGGKHPDRGMGASAPIITENDSSGENPKSPQ